MKPLTVLGIYREKRFSPGKVEADAAILDATLDRLRQAGWTAAAIPGEAIGQTTGTPAMVVSMAQSDAALNTLESWSRQGIRVVNSAQSIRNCYRKPQIRLLQEAHLPLPFSRIAALQELEPQGLMAASGRCWLKRGDVHAMQAQDVVCVTSEGELRKALEYFERQDVADILVQQHVEGSVVKFYGVTGKAFFQAFSADNGQDVTASVGALPDIAQQAAQATGLEVYGGDAVLTPDNRVVLIDLNDWPSFSKCCQSAAQSIAEYLLREKTAGTLDSMPNRDFEKYPTERMVDFKTA